MVDRPFSESRPIGPLINLDNLGEDGKNVLGVSGTPFPNRDKNPLVAVYVLEGDHLAGLPSYVSGRMGEKIRDKIGNVRVKTKKSGRSSRAPFDNQAVIVRIPGEMLPIQDNHLHKISDTIERHIQQEGYSAGVKALLIDQE